MTTKEVAMRLVELNCANDYPTVYAELYEPDVVSVENWGERMEYRGMAAIKEKGEVWKQNLVEMHATTVSEPVVADKSFAVTFFIDATFKDMGRQTMTELAVYRVNENGKIYHEEFLG